MKIDFPLEIKISETERDKAAFHQSLKDLMTDNIVVLTGQTYSYDIALNLLKTFDFKPRNLFKIKNNAIVNIEKKFDLFKDSEITILAIGGGKVCDVAKRLAFNFGSQLILYPTVVANDGLLSPIAVISDGKGSVSLPAKMPNHVFIDLLLIRSAPRKYIIAAALDLLTNISATQDWHYASEEGEKGLNHLAFQLSRMAANQLLDCVSWDSNSDEFLRAVIHGQMLSAISMAYAGSSRPCSGSEHLISHALDRLDIGDDILHGQKVGRASLFTTYLQGNLNEKILKLVQSFDVPITFVNNFISDETLLQIFETCRIVRPGRKTVLDKYSNKELLIKYHEFQSGNY